MSEDSPAPDWVVPADVPVPPDTIVRQHGGRPRVWTVFTVYALAFAGTIIAQIAAVAIFVAWHVLRGGDIQQIKTELPRMISAPEIFIALGLVSQIVIGLAAIVPASRSPEPIRLRLGWVNPNLPGWSYPVIAMSVLVPFALGLALAIGVTQLIKPDESVQQLYDQISWRTVVPFVLFIALVPAFLEELLFRGYIQRRLLQRWSPWVAIFVTSVLFTLMHITPQAMAAVFPLGIWLGVLAWRTGSVWPGIVCHAFVNGSWNIFQTGVKLGKIPENPPVPALVALGVVALGCFLVTLYLIARRPREMPDAVPVT
jgi:membrane protease YdiL (CAAX protease family)